MFFTPLKKLIYSLYVSKILTPGLTQYPWAAKRCACQSRFHHLFFSMALHFGFSLALLHSSIWSFAVHRVQKYLECVTSNLVLSNLCLDLLQHIITRTYHRATGQFTEKCFHYFSSHAHVKLCGSVLVNTFSFAYVSYEWRPGTICWNLWLIKPCKYLYLEMLPSSGQI